MYKCILSFVRWCHKNHSWVAVVTEARCIFDPVEQNVVSEVQNEHINIGLNQHLEWE